MKQSAKILLFPLLSYLIAVAPVAADQHDNATAENDKDERETLYIEYQDNRDSFREPRYNSMNNEQERFYYLKRNFEKVFEKEEWPVKFEFQRFPVKAPEGAKVLHLNFLSLNSPNRIELELRLWAKMSRGNEADDFGVQLVRHVPSMVATSSSIERDLDEIYAKAARKVAEELNKTLFNEE